MSTSEVLGKKLRRFAMGAAVALLVCSTAGAAFAQSSGNPKVGVIDVQRLLAESNSGKRALESLKKLRDSKQTEIQNRQKELKDLQGRLTEGRLSLSADRITDLEKELEEKAIALQRFQDDAERELQKSRDTAFDQVERRLMPIIDQVGKEQNYTLIFNKYQSGLLFALEEADITGQILERFNQGDTAAPGGGG